MRYLFGFLCVCALGVVPLVGCDLDLFPCAGVVCEDDGNPCTREDCRGGSCYSWTVTDGTPCTFDGLAGVCVEGVCGENPCDDGNECTNDLYSEGSCEYAGCTGCRPCDWNGEPGVCIDGVCQEDVCRELVCDDDNACTDDTCDYVEGTCHFPPMECDDRNECTEDTCNPTDGCNYTPVEGLTYCLGAPAEICKAGACVPLPTDACTNAEDLAVVCDPSFDDEVATCALGAFLDPAGTALCLIANTDVSADCVICYAGCMFGSECTAPCRTAPHSEECANCLAFIGCDCLGDLTSACPPDGTMFDVRAFEAQP